MANNSSNVSPVSDYLLTKVELKTHTGQVLDLRFCYSDISITESIFSPVVYGTIVLSETFNFPSFGPILGGEVIDLEIKNIGNFKYSQNPVEDSNQLIKHTFTVYDVEFKRVLKNRFQMYILKFCSKDVIWNQQIRICTTLFNQSYSEMALNIFSIYGAEVEKLKEGREQLTNNPNSYSRPEEDKVLVVKGRGDANLNCHFPNLHPFECLNYLSGKAQKGIIGNPYFFFESLDHNFYFMSWNDLLEKYNHSKGKTIPDNLKIQKDSSESNKYIFINNNQALEDKFDQPSTGYFHPEEDFFAAIVFEGTKDFDFLENVKKGVYASSLVTYDHIEKKIKKHNYSFDKMYSDIPRIYSGKNKALNLFEKESGDNIKRSVFMSPEYQETYIKTSSIHSSLFVNGQNDFTPEKTRNYRLMKLQEFNNNIFTANITGNLSFLSGRFTDVYLNSPDTTTGVKLKADPHFAGTYFNLRVRHSFGPDGHCITVVEMAKDSFMKETKQTLEKSS